LGHDSLVRVWQSHYNLLVWDSLDHGRVIGGDGDARLLFARFTSELLLMRRSWGLLLKLLLLFHEILLPNLSNVRRELRGRYVMQLLVVYQNFWWQTFQDPRMSQSLIRTHTGFRVPIKTSMDKVNERFVFACKYLIYVL
jgi:hypothetical protein